MVLTLVLLGTLESSLLAPDGYAKAGFQDAVLIAGGANSPDELARGREQMDRALTRVAKQLTEKRPTGENIHTKLLQVLHERWLLTYVASEYDVRNIWKHRRFNCLTGTLFYLLAADHLGLTAKGFAHTGHVMIVAFTAKGPRFLESTNPSIPPAKRWDPSWYDQFDVKEAVAAQAELAQQGQSAAELQFKGDDAAAEKVLQQAAETAIRPIRKAQERAKRLKASGSEVSSRAMVGLVYWNRMVRVMSRGNVPRGLELFQAFRTLTGKEVSPDTGGARLIRIDTVLESLSHDKGWRSAEQLVDALLATEQPAQEHAFLRDVRARLWSRVALRAKGAARCRVVDHAYKVDATHPALEKLQILALRSGCR
ncbi:MAG: hypothetical protein AAF654_03745 [Myxococcota bacterium]